MVKKWNKIKKSIFSKLIYQILTEMDDVESDVETEHTGDRGK